MKTEERQIPAQGRRVRFSSHFAPAVRQIYKKPAPPAPGAKTTPLARPAAGPRPSGALPGSGEKGYAGIDRFRLVAALLVVAVHTSPLLSFGAQGDFIFTRVFARLGVPFFFAATGFFLLSRYAGRQSGVQSGAPVGRFVLKAALLYGVAILLYLPVNLYAGHLSAATRAPQLLKMLLVDGTMYHLWYLPAVMLGVVLVWLMLRYTNLMVATGLCAGLYLVGLFGDSYYGIAAGLPAVKGFYDGLFTLCQYTRNGLFFAPLFLLMGVWAARMRKPLPRGRALAGLCICLALMVAEGLLLYTVGVQRHDSMYILLPFCLFFLFSWLLTFRGPSSRMLRSLSMLVYLLHPLVIVLVRGGAKALGAEELLVKNSLVHYLVVCAGALALGWGVWKLGTLITGKKKREAAPRAWAEIRMSALEENVRVLRGLLPPGCALMPAVKADAYGLGAVEICRGLNRMGVEAFCVATLAEGVELRQSGVEGEILILGYTPPEEMHRVQKYRLAQTVVDGAYAARLAEQGGRTRVHVKVDSGMHRLGERAGQSDTLAEILENEKLRVAGMFTQLGCCDSTDAEDIAYTKAQVEAFAGLAARLQSRGIRLPALHLQCSYGIFNYPGIRADYARPGLALYGIVDETLCVEEAPPLVPVFEVKARLGLVKTIYPGQRVGYGRAFVAPKEMQIAVVTLGYADGLPRSLSRGAGGVLVRGRYAPVVGNICMDQALVDVSGIEEAAPGDTAVLIGQSGELQITVNALAARAGTIPNEIISRLGRRLERRYL